MPTIIPQAVRNIPPLKILPAAAMATWLAAADRKMPRSEKNKIGGEAT